MSRCKNDCGKWAFSDGFCRTCAKQADLAKTPTCKSAPVLQVPAASTSFQLEPSEGSERTVAASELELVTQRGLQLHEEELRASRETLGDRHPDTLSAIDSMATLLEDMGQLGEARPLYEEALRARRETLGNRHQETLLSISNMGQLLQAMGQLEEARALYEEALQASREVLGDRHPETLTLLDSINTLHEASRGQARTLPLYAELEGV